MYINNKLLYQVLRL